MSNKHDIVLIPGDGIGPEITKVAVEIIDATGVDIKWHEVYAGESALCEFGDTLPHETLATIRKYKIALKGPLTTPIGEGYQSVNLRIRKALDLYANLRPIKKFKGIETPFDDIDIIIVRENTEDLYSGLEHIVVPGVVESLKIITERASRRIAKFAYSVAEKWNRKKVTAVHKANIMKLSDGLFLKTVREEAVHHPEIEYNELIVDNAAMQMVMNPSQFDILLTENLYGDIFSDLAAGLVGGLGLAPGSNIGDEIAVFEAVHGSAPDIAGKNIANPIAITLAGALMLDWIGEAEAAQLIRKAIEDVLSEGKVKTRDLGGDATTTEMGKEIIRKMEELKGA